MNANDIETALRARAAFNESVEHIDADTRRRLRELRLQVLNTKPQRARWMWPVGAALASALAVVVFLPPMLRAPAASDPVTTAEVAQPVPTSATVHPAHMATTNEIVASDTIEVVDPDMLSDLDFYGWLAKQPNTDASGG
jgi:hypothetical protein